MSDRHICKAVSREQLTESRNSFQLTAHSSRGFTLIEVLVAVSILAILMTIIYSTFSISSNHAAIVEERANEVSSVVGALDTMSREIRGSYMHSEGIMRNFAGKKGLIDFITTAPYSRDGQPNVQRISYLFEDGKLIRKTVHTDKGKEGEEEFLLLNELESSSFSFYDGKKWVNEWNSDLLLPFGVKVIFSYRGREIQNVIPVWSRM